MTALRLAKEYGLKPVLCLATEGLPDRRQAGGGQGAGDRPPDDAAPSSMETFNGCLGNAATLADRNIAISLGTAFEGYVPKQRVLRYEAAMARSTVWGLTVRCVPSRWTPPSCLDRRPFGSIENGKVADLVLYDGDPFETHHARDAHDHGWRVVWTGRSI